MSKLENKDEIKQESTNDSFHANIDQLYNNMQKIAIHWEGNSLITTRELIIFDLRHKQVYSDSHIISAIPYNKQLVEYTNISNSQKH